MYDPANRPARALGEEVRRLRARVLQLQEDYSRMEAWGLRVARDVANASETAQKHAAGVITYRARYRAALAALRASQDHNKFLHDKLTTTQRRLDAIRITEASAREVIAELRQLHETTLYRLNIERTRHAQTP